MRTRDGDPALGAAPHAASSAREAQDALRAVSRVDAPSIEASSSAGGQQASGAESQTIILPVFGARKKLAARDPRAVVEGFMYEVKFKLP